MMEVGVIAGPFESTTSGGKYAKMYDYAPGMPKELNVAGPLYHLAPVFHLLRVLGLTRKETRLTWGTSWATIPMHRGMRSISALSSARFNPEPLPIHVCDRDKDYS